MQAEAYVQQLEREALAARAEVQAGKEALALERREMAAEKRRMEVEQRAAQHQVEQRVSEGLQQAEAEGRQWRQQAEAQRRHQQEQHEQRHQQWQRAETADRQQWMQQVLAAQEGLEAEIKAQHAAEVRRLQEVEAELRADRALELQVAAERDCHLADMQRNQSEIEAELAIQLASAKARQAELDEACRLVQEERQSLQYELSQIEEEKRPGLADVQVRDVWVQPTTSGAAPARWGAAYALVDGGGGHYGSGETVRWLVVLGGKSGNGSHALHDVHLLELGRLTWRHLPTFMKSSEDYNDNLSNIARLDGGATPLPCTFQGHAAVAMPPPLAPLSALTELPNPRVLVLGSPPKATGE
jgi:hypothetical protein